MIADWTPTKNALPVHNAQVMWLCPNTGKVVVGAYRGVWIMDNGTYVYYTPTFWRYTPNGRKTAATKP